MPTPVTKIRNGPNKLGHQFPDTLTNLCTEWLGNQPLQLVRYANPCSVFLLEASGFELRKGVYRSWLTCVSTFFWLVADLNVTWSVRRAASNKNCSIVNTDVRCNNALWYGYPRVASSSLSLA